MKNGPLHHAALRGHFDIVKYLLDKGASVTSVNDFQQTPFAVALSNMDNSAVVSTIVLFIERGYNVNKQNKVVCLQSF